MAVRSNTEPRLSAETTPVETPVTSQITAAPKASDAVTGSRPVSGGSGSDVNARLERYASAAQPDAQPKERQSLGRLIAASAAMANVNGIASIRLNNGVRCSGKR